MSVCHTISLLRMWFGSVQKHQSIGTFYIWWYKMYFRVLPKPFSLTNSPQPLDLNFWAYCIIIGFWFLLFGLKIHCNLWPYYCLLIFTFIPHQLCRCLRTAPTIDCYRLKTSTLVANCSTFKPITSDWDRMLQSPQSNWRIGEQWLTVECFADRSLKGISRRTNQYR